MSVKTKIARGKRRKEQEEPPLPVLPVLYRKLWFPVIPTACICCISLIDMPPPSITESDEVVVVTAAAAKNIIIPNALTPVRMEWSISTATGITASATTTNATTSTSVTVNKKKNSVNLMLSVPHIVATRRNIATTAPTCRSSTSNCNSILIHQSNQEETWPGGAIWDISWCMAQLIIGVILLQGDTPSSTSRSGSTTTSNVTTKTKTNIAPPPTHNIHTITTFYHNIDMTNSSLPPANPPDVSSECCCYVSNTLRIPQRLYEWIHQDHPEPCVAALAALMMNGGHARHSKPSKYNKSSSRCISSNSKKDKTNHSSHSSVIVLELGCGTGWTGIAMAAAAASSSSSSSSSTTCTVLLTDLDVVVQNITLPNVQRNVPSIKHNVIKTTFPLYTNDANDKESVLHAPKPQLPLHIYTMNSSSSIQGRLIATPLCWGNKNDMNTVQSVIRYLQSQPTQEPNKSIANTTTVDLMDGIPDILIVGDVAYQHKPGAASHFDILLETILHFTKCRDTLLIFGLRIRMNASMDLYDMLLQDFVDVVEPIVPHEIDPIRFPNHTNNNTKKHMNTMTIHFMKRKSCTNETTTTE